jgi:hypothetical protein
MVLLAGAAPAAAQPAPAPLPPVAAAHAADDAFPQPGAGPLRPAAFQGDATGDQLPGYRIQTEPPGLERIAMSAQTDESLQERIRQEHRGYNERVTFPPSPILTTEQFQLRSWEPSKVEVAPNYVIYRRLYFQQLNFERYGWDLGMITPLLSASGFLFDFVSWPYHAFSDPCRCMDSNAGYCLPGDPVPLMLYPPEISLTGFVAETGSVLALVAIFP